MDNELVFKPSVYDQKQFAKPLTMGTFGADSPSNNSWNFGGAWDATKDAFSKYSKLSDDPQTNKELWYSIGAGLEGISNSNANVDREIANVLYSPWSGSKLDKVGAPSLFKTLSAADLAQRKRADDKLREDRFGELLKLWGKSDAVIDPDKQRVINQVNENKGK
jgi:hypothetical protein